MRRPTQNPITLPFGATSPPYNSDNPHKGTDYSYKPNDTIYAPFSGKVTQAYNDRDGYGTYMTDPQGRFHGLLHASRYLVPNGTNVVEGEAIAVMGETGFAQGKHLHWCIKENGKFIDPESIIGKEEDMYQGKSAQEWAAIAKDGQKWKPIGQAFSFTSVYSQKPIGGTPGDPDGDPAYIDIVIKDLVKNKEENLSKPSKFKKLEEDVYVEV